MRTARRFVATYHYAHDWGAIGKIYLGLFEHEKLVGVGIWGYGTRPLHTIRKCFPSLGVTDYLELNRLCLLDEMPRNSETQFLAMQTAFIKSRLPTIKVLFSWADGLRGKPGYIYQAASWLYGGFITSEFYISGKGDVVHPRLLITRDGTRTRAHTEGLGLTKLWGYQFRYCKFLCSKGAAKKLLKESQFTWNQKYPKAADCKCFRQAGEGSRENCELPKLNGSGQFRHPAPLFEGVTSW